MVEADSWCFDIQLFSIVNKDWKRWNARRRQHGNKERSFVAADTVSIFKCRTDIVWLISRRICFCGDTHVTNLLADKLEDCVDALIISGHSRCDFSDFRLHFWSGLFQMGLSEFGVPLADFLPIRKRADE